MAAARAMLNQHAKGWTGIQGRTAKRSGPTKSARSVTVRAASRELWLPGGEPPKHLDGSLAGDYGFDPLNLGSDPEALKWYVKSRVHPRTTKAHVEPIRKRKGLDGRRKRAPKEVVRRVRSTKRVAAERCDAGTKLTAETKRNERVRTAGTCRQNWSTAVLPCWAWSVCWCRSS
mmetsp:Transcript_10744/g.66268  ORF Transcript_10744/g.66268 Transcript_10744/m.66268 type:complete len:174 (-) Transcript_10744:474-995(-)